MVLTLTKTINFCVAMMTINLLCICLVTLHLIIFCQSFPLGDEDKMFALNDFEAVAGNQDDINIELNQDENRQIRRKRAGLDRLKAIAKKIQDIIVKGGTMFCLITQQNNP
uniref:Uncharacterized protein n=1 Tax=Strigamia maritima TaxID=126957 RepID=T1J1F7_STRMM